MHRAAVLIGVNRTGGGLPVLRDAAKSARRMETWARAQGFKDEDIVVITDENRGSVDVGTISKAIRRFNELGTIDQLIVFFAGHGINLLRGERWLLTDAPGDSNAAVNVSGSADLARWGGIRHVVMISDACRTAAEGIQAQGVTGSNIFPNEEIAELELPVDQFFACRLGRPSYEIPDAQTTARDYKAIYTAALISALKGADRALLDAEGYVRPRPLKNFLQLELARRLRDLPPQAKLVQVPDAHIASDYRAWISRVVSRGAPPAPRSVSPEGQGGSTLKGTFDALLSPILTGSLEGFEFLVREKREADEPRIADIATAVESTASPFGPMRYETQYGIKVRGARIVEVVAEHDAAEQVSDHLVRFNSPWRRGTVLVVLDHGAGIAVPMIPEFIAAVTVDEGEVVDLAYEPSEGTWRWDLFNERAREVRALRAVAASASREGAFELDGEDAFEVARRMQYAKGIDPALAIYAGYAYADIGRRDLIREMHGFMLSDLGAVLFDVALLAREPDGRSHLGTTKMFGFAPLLAQGWALLPSSRVMLPSLEELQRHVLPGSLWTLYNEEGVERIRHAIASGEVR
jgi:Caspase domain